MQTTATEKRRQERHDTTVSIRIPKSKKELIEQAANTVNKSFSAFMIDSASQEAVHVLLDQTVFNLSADAAEASASVLDNPPPPPRKSSEH